jgi:hypothetical protein
MKPERSVTDGIFRHQLEGFQKYPVKRDSRFLEVFNECVVSVGHAQAVAESFQGLMPTLEEIRDVARSLRPRFEVTVDQKEEWRRKYGPSSPVRPDFAQRPAREIDRLWGEVRAFLVSTQFDGRGDIQRVHIGRCWQIAKHLGYEMNSYQQREIDDYERIYPKSRERLPQKKAPITQADFKALAAGEEAEGRWE